MPYFCPPRYKWHNCACVCVHVRVSVCVFTCLSWFLLAQSEFKLPVFFLTAASLLARAWKACNKHAANIYIAKGWSIYASASSTEQWGLCKGIAEMMVYLLFNPSTKHNHHTQHMMTNVWCFFHYVNKILIRDPSTLFFLWTVFSAVMFCTIVSVFLGCFIGLSRRYVWGRNCYSHFTAREIKTHEK